MLLKSRPDTPTISILICSRDRRSDLEKIVQDLKLMNTSYQFDVIVVEETNDPVLIDGVVYISHPVKNLGFPYARNLSISQSTGEIMVFVDDDCQVKEGWLDKLLRPFEDNSVIGVQGGVVVPDGTNAVGWTESILGFPGGGFKRIIKSGGVVQDTIEISTLNSAYRREGVEAVGGFNNSLKWGGEDYLLAKKVCHYGKLLFVPDALVAHRARGDLSSIWHWFVRRGQAEIGVVRSKDYAGSSWGSILRSSLTFKLFVISLLWLFLSVELIYIIPCVFFLYSILQYYRNFFVWRRSQAPLESFLIIPFVKLTMDLAADAGRFKGILRG
jgi:GT2 family glycosyltransferase